MRELTIGGRKVSSDTATLIIAEAGINHDGIYEQALRLADVAKEAGADIVKYQLFKAKKMYTDKAGLYTTASGKQEDINKILESVELPYEWIPKLQDYCEKIGIGFLCTVCDEVAADVLYENNVDSFKMASYAITHIPLLKHVSKYNKPVVFSSAGAYLSDVDIAIRTIRECNNEQIALMHCVAKYPTPLEECNLNIIETFKTAFPDVVIGYSDHTAEPIVAPVNAVIKGAKIIEKHFTVDKSLPGADHSFSLSPEELKQMCKAIRKVEKLSGAEQHEYVNTKVLGSSEKTVLGIEKNLRDYAYRCVFATQDIRMDEKITVENTAILRPGNSDRGIEPYMYEVLLGLNAKVNKNIMKGDPIKWEDVLNK